MDLKIKDVTELLGVSEATIKRWLAEGKIPAYRIDQQYRFNRTELEDWVISHRQHQEDDVFTDVETGAVLGNNQFSLTRAIHKGGVFQQLPGNNKEEIIRATMQQLATPLNLDADLLTELLLDRENLQSTGLNNGFGIPHTRDFLLSTPVDVVTVVFPKKPIPYGALDGQPVHTLFFLFACDDKRHLHLLAKIAHLSSLPKAQKFLQSQPDREALLSFVKEWEANIQPANVLT